MAEEHKVRVDTEGAAVLKDVDFLTEVADSLPPIENSNVPYSEYEVSVQGYTECCTEHAECTE